MRFHGGILLLLCMLLLSGCGGGGSAPAPLLPPPDPGPTNPAPTPAARAQITIYWGARSRNVNAPSSALSAVVTLQGAATQGGDISFTINRRTAPGAYSETYRSPVEARVGTWALSVVFHAGEYQNGAVVGRAATVVTIQADGTGIGAINTVGTIVSVEMAANQSIGVGEKKDLAFSAKNTNGEIIAVSPGSAFFTVAGGGERLRITDGKGEGVAPGAARVAAAVDGVSSTAIDVAVTSNAAVSITPGGPINLSINANQKFTARVTETENQGVTWAVQEGAAGGRITAEGVYTAPNTPGTYHILATSHYDPVKQAVVTVTVQSGSVDVDVSFSDNGDLPIIVD